jgi:hypothetical protein
MNRRRNLAISAAAAVLAGVLIYCIHELQLRQIELQETVQVVVPVRFIPAGERLSADALGMKTITKAAFMPGMVTDLHAVAGMETAVPLGRDEPVLDWKLDRFRLLPKRGESTFQIPKDYILSVSNGLRAGDKALVYASGEGIESGRLFPEPVTVAAVKTPANLEVDDPQHTGLVSRASGDYEQLYLSRRDANGSIDAINLNLTEEQWLRIDNLCRSGKVKLVIAYVPDSHENTAADAGKAEEVEVS